MIRNKYEKMRRNEICPCEENDNRENKLKYKNCCGKELQAKEQKTYEMVHENRRIDELKNKAKAIMQDKKDHPIIVPESTKGDGTLLLPGRDF